MNTVDLVERTSDETRFTGVLLALVAMAAALGLGLWLSLDGAQQRSPGPLALPHVSAGLTCASCHLETTPAAQACAGCHAGHASTRAPHHKLRTQGKLGCVDCHRVHEDLSGIRFDGQGGATLFTSGARTNAPVASSLPAGTVAVVRARSCIACHRGEDPQDPAARCFAGHNISTGKPSLCFDEHQLGRHGPGQRNVLWAAARDLLAEYPVPDPPRQASATAAGPRPPNGPTGLTTVWALVGGSLVVGGAVLVGLRWRRAGAAAQPTLLPVPQAPKRRRLPQINAATCIGCSACIDACPYDVLALERYVAKLVRPDDCCGVLLCEQRCPNGSLVIQEGTMIEGLPQLDTQLQSLDRPGIYLAGDVSGLSLIRNAIAQGTAAVRSIVATAAPVPAECPQYDVVIVGAGPAGLSAALEAKAQGQRYVVLEQSSVAHSIRSFPRGKLVFDQPLGLPLVGDLWLAESTKEELLSKWERIVRQHKLCIREHQRVVGLEGSLATGFDVQVRGDESAVEVVRTRAVVLAFGRRGTPRKLPIAVPQCVVARVHYALADARSFAGRRVVVVGLGDVALETATALAMQPDTHVTMVARGSDFRRGKQRNIDSVTRLMRRGQIVMHWASQVGELRETSLAVEGPKGRVELKWDAMFVMIGNIAPRAFLASMGVRLSSADAP